MTRLLIVPEALCVRGQENKFNLATERKSTNTRTTAVPVRRRVPYRVFSRSETSRRKLLFPRLSLLISETLTRVVFGRTRPSASELTFRRPPVWNGLYVIVCP